jgi:hypothetical protein
MAPEPPRMSSGFKTALAIALFPTFAWVLCFSAFVLAFPGVYNDAPYAVRLILLSITIPATIIGALAGLYGFVWVIQKLRGNERIGWVIGFLVGGSITALIWWWVLIRPLPEPS